MEKGTVNARSHKGSDTNEAFTPLGTPAQYPAAAAQKADHRRLERREGDLGVVEPADVSNLRVLLSSVSPDEAGSDTAISSRTTHFRGGVGTIIVGFSPGTAYLGAFLQRLFSKVFHWADKVIQTYFLSGIVSRETRVTVACCFSGRARGR